MCRDPKAEKSLKGPGSLKEGGVAGVLLSGRSIREMTESLARTRSWRAVSDIGEDCILS